MVSGKEREEEQSMAEGVDVWGQVAMGAPMVLSLYIL
jgi:hypothetical protein